MNELPIILSLFSLKISIFSLLITFFNYRRNERKTEFDTQPLYRVTPIECSSHNTHLLEIKNTGKGDAENIEVRLQILGEKKINKIKEFYGTYPNHVFIINIEEHLQSDKNFKLHIDYNSRHSKKHYRQAFTILTTRNEKKAIDGSSYQVIEIKDISNSHLVASKKNNINFSSNKISSVISLD